jgi:cell division protein FtsB
VRRVTWAACASVVLVGVLFVAGFPLHTYLTQRQSLNRAERQATSLARSNKALAAEVKSLQTDSAVEQIARSEYGMVKPGEVAYTILPAPPAKKPARAHAAATGSRGRVSARARRSGTAPARQQQGLLARILDEFSF